MDKDLETLKEERASIPGRLAGYLLWQSILILAFAEIIAQSWFLSFVLSALGLVSSLIGLGNFWSLPAKIDSLEGRKDKGARRFIRRIFQGRTIGIECSAMFAIFWICAIIWRIWGGMF
ncbi:MAG: hypothetical protein DDT31_01705 [Syntrophomonadaceae bacterium]|nr:hypothetical protein [Bacillota bacterium]MBT9148269.1 hypothetical protein [Bacillota bacterium]